MFSQPAGAALPALLLDAVEFGLFLKITGCGPDPINAFRHALSMQRVLVAGDDPRRIRLSVPVVEGTVIGVLDVRLFVTRVGDDGLVVQNASSIAVNSLRMLRAKLGATTCGGLGLDRNDNVIGPTLGRAPDLLAAQLLLVTAGLDAVAEVIDAALPVEAEATEEELWLRSAEVCLDLPCDQPVALVRSLQRAALPGAVRTTFDLYRTRCEYLNGLPVVRWWRRLTGPAFKAYAKRENLVRAEVAFADLDAVKALLGKRKVTYLDGLKGAGLLIAFARKAEPELAELVNHVLDAERGDRTLGELLVRLLPLIGLADGALAGAGRRPGPACVAAAREALDALLLMGSYRAKGPKEGGLRACLDRLAGPGGPLVRFGHQAVYALRPEYASAAAAIDDWRAAA